MTERKLTRAAIAARGDLLFEPVSGGSSVAESPAAS